MKWNHVVPVLGIALLASGGAGAADLDAALGLDIDYDDNVTRLQGGQGDDVIFRIAPTIRIFEDEGRSNWEIEYSAPYERAISNPDRINTVYHYVNASGDYKLNDRTKLFATEVFSYSEALDTLLDDSNPLDPVIVASREPVLRNRAMLGTQYRFTPRLAGNLAFTHRLFESDIPDRANNQAIVGNTNLRYALSPRHQVGGGLSTTFQLFDEANDGSRPSSESTFVNAFGIYTWAIDETTSFQLTAGPTFIESRRKGRQPAQRWTIFGSATLEKQWSPNLSSAGSYTRQDSTASGVASSSILDLVTLVTRWRITERLNASVRGDFAQRVAVDSSDVVDELESIRWSAGARIQYYWTRQLSTALRYTYNFQRTDTASASDADFQNNIVSVGVKYDFDQWHLW